MYLPYNLACSIDKVQMNCSPGCYGLSHDPGDRKIYTVVHPHKLAEVDGLTGSVSEVNPDVNNNNNVILCLEIDVNGITYGVDFWDGVLYQIDENSVANPIGPTGNSGGFSAGSISDLAFDSQWMLYAIRFDDILLTIDTATGLSSYVGVVTGLQPGEYVSGITFDRRSDILYASARVAGGLSSTSLYTVALDTLQATFIGYSGLSDGRYIHFTC